MGLPEGTTWLDVATLVVALGGLALAAANVALRVRRDRAESRHTVRMMIGILPRWPDEDIYIDLTNPAPRKITIVTAGFAQSRSGLYPAYDWEGTFAPPRANRPRIAVPPSQPVPVTLESGMPAHRLQTPVWKVRNTYNRIIPLYAWCEDSYGSRYFQVLPLRVINTIKATKRRKLGPPDKEGNRPIVEVSESERIDFPDRVG